MKKLATALVAFVALEHILFLVLEMFFWTTPTGIKVFGLTPELAEQSSALAANQGQYK
jgi:putative membrane protein